MSSDDTSTARLSVELLQQCIRVANTDDLAHWPESPIGGFDLGSQTVRDSTFGKLGLPVIHNGQVLLGSRIVDAERIEPKDGGRCLIIDLPADWTRNRAEAAVLGEIIGERDSTVDDVLLAEIATRLATEERELFEQTGMDGDDLDALIERIEADQHNVGLADDPDNIPELHEGPTTTQPGDRWQLGAHTLVCGDSATATSYPTDGLASLLVTDPPYGVSYADKNATLNAADGGDRVEREIKNDNLTPEDTQRLWIEVFKCCEVAMAPGAAFYVTGAAMGDLLLLLLALKEAGLPPRHGLVWLKNNHVLGFTDYNYKHEPITYGWKDGGHKFYGDGADKSVWEIDKPSSSKLHPTMKPVELYERAINNSSKFGELVLEPFAGSGTCIIACETTGRVCHAIELDPHYCDVICERWERVTGIKPVLEATGEPHSFVEVV